MKVERGTFILEVDLLKPECVQPPVFTRPGK